MRKHMETGEEVILCNLCGKRILLERGIVKEGVMPVEQHWGYFSNKDGQVHSFDLCEQCYDKLIESFLLPVSIKEEVEWI